MSEKNKITSWNYKISGQEWGKILPRHTDHKQRKKKQIYKVTVTFFAARAPKKEEHGCGCLSGP